MAPPDTQDALVASGQLGGRTVRIVASGEVECAVLPVADLAADQVRIRTIRSAVSPGTEMTFLGRDATNVYLHRQWDRRLRLFVEGSPSLAYPVTFGYRAAGEVVESRDPEVPLGRRVFGNWRHTEYVAMPASQARRQLLPAGLDWDDGVDIGQMGPICLNAAAFGEGRQVGRPAVIIGAGPIGLITAQLVRLSGASRVYVVDRLQGRLAIAERLGLMPIDASSAVDVAVMLKRRHGASGVPVVWECSGSTAALGEAIRIVARQGTVVAVGFYQGEPRGLRLDEEFHHNGVQLVCGQIGNVHRSMRRRGLPTRVLALVRAGRLVLGGLPRETFPIERVGDAFAALRRPDEILQVALAYD
jgi:NADPH:quinone reductase-like Zn-dependent oxidoreductase